ncbi:hypothetical protein N7535_003325 [Penicillium sp. DV-2018c]|nr:hypothetical protein N7535_003325 [Penicillium sp. DV-2018c]
MDPDSPSKRARLNSPGENVNTVPDAETASNQGPLVVFIARGAPIVTPASLEQQKSWLDPALIELKERFEHNYGKITNRPYASCPMIHVSFEPIDPSSDSFRSMIDILEWGRAEKCEVILVTNHWDAITSHEESLVNIFKDYKDVSVRMRVWGVYDRRMAPKFHELNPHRVCDYYRGLIKVDDVPVMDGLRVYLRMVQAVKETRLSVVRGVDLMERMTGQPQQQMRVNIMRHL